MDEMIFRGSVSHFLKHLIKKPGSSNGCVKQDMIRKKQKTKKGGGGRREGEEIGRVLSEDENPQDRRGLGNDHSGYFPKG